MNGEFYPMSEIVKLLKILGETSAAEKISDLKHLMNSIEVHTATSSYAVHKEDVDMYDPDDFGRFIKNTISRQLAEFINKDMDVEIEYDPSTNSYIYRTYISIAEKKTPTIRVNAARSLFNESNKG